MQIILNKKLLFSSNLTLGPSLTKICLNTQKQAFVETVLLSTHETLRIKKYILYSESNQLYNLFDVTFDVQHICEVASMYLGSSC